MDNRDQTIKGFYEVISAYVTDTLFNHLYVSAKQSSKSLFDSYIDCVNAYVTTVKSDKAYYDTISEQIYKYFIHFTKYKNIGYGEFVDLIIKASVPNDYFEKLSKTNRLELCGNIICDCITNMAIYVVNIEIATVIVSKNQRMIQAKSLTDDIKKMGVDVLFSKRSELFNKFYQKKHQSRNACIDSANLAAIKTQLKEMVKKKVAAEMIAHAYATKINKLTKINGQIKDKYKNKIEALQIENNKLKAKIKKKSKYDIIVTQEDKTALSSAEEESVEEESVEEESAEEVSVEEESVEEESVEKGSVEEESAEKESVEEEFGEEESGEVEESNDDSDTVGSK